MAYPSSNNKLRVLSGNSSTAADAAYRRLSDADLASVTAQNGAPYGETANSSLYNSLSLSLSLPVVAFVEFLAENNNLTTFGQGLSIENWVTSVKNTFALKSTVDGLSTSVSNIVNGTTTVGNALSAVSALSAVKATNDSNNNPINSTYAKISDFNTSSQTKFGDYIITKKKLLWSGSAGCSYNEYSNTGSSGSVTFSTPASSSSALLEVWMGGRPHFLEASGNADIFYDRTFLVEGNYNYLNFFSVSLTLSTTGITFNMNSVQLKVSLTSDTNVTNKRDNIYKGFVITKVYEIIE